MYSRYTLITLVFVCLLKFSTTADYCKKTSKHFLCGRKDFSSSCGDRSKILGTKVSEKDKVVIIQAHNEFRNSVASGKATTGKNPGDIRNFHTAANMEEMVWDNELAAVAEAYAKGCTFDHSDGDQREVERFRVGENLHWVGSSYGGKSLFDYSWRDIIVKAWSVDEAKSYHADDVDKFQATSKSGIELGKWAHLTQTAWAASRYVGCARVAFNGAKGWELVSACHYGPNGNTIGAEVYKRGPPCSQCSGGRGCSPTYASLCRSQGSPGSYPPHFNPGPHGRPGNYPTNYKPGSQGRPGKYPTNFNPGSQGRPGNYPPNYNPGSQGRPENYPPQHNPESDGSSQDVISYDTGNQDESPNNSVDDDYPGSSSVPSEDGILIIAISLLPFLF